MVRLSFLSDGETIAALRDELLSNAMLSDVEEKPGSQAELERLGFDLGVVEMLVGAISAGVTAAELVKCAYRALKKSGSKRLEITGPTGRVTIDVAGKSQEEIEELVRKAIPILK